MYNKHYYFLKQKIHKKISVTVLRMHLHTTHKMKTNSMNVFLLCCIIFQQYLYH